MSSDYLQQNKIIWQIATFRRKVSAQKNYLAGIYRIESGKPIFTVLTSAAAEGISFIHERMPVVLPQEATRDWLNPRYHGNDILKSALTEMEYMAC